jgi:hypothetical protein
MPKTASQLPALGSTRDRLEALLKRAEAGDQDARVAARILMDAEPEVWRTLADLPLQAEFSLLAATYGEWSLPTMAVQRRLAELRGELGRVGATTLEQLAIDRVVTTWLAVHLAEIVVAQSKASLAQLDFYQRRATQAQRRHLAAIRTLAVLRRLLTPSVPRVNIARVDQVNVAADGGQQLNVARENGHLPTPTPSRYSALRGEPST